jgi:hypothetical protein
VFAAALEPKLAIRLRMLMGTAIKPAGKQPHEQDDLEGVGPMDGHPIPGTQTVGAKAARQAVRGLVQFVISERPLAVDQGRFAGISSSR